MAIQDYYKALKLGEKDFRSNGNYLPVLDEILEHVEIDSQVNLGLVEIPIKSIKGTYSAGRTTAFASNFMPILEPDSEFANKWAKLYDDLEEEGLRDPIQAYEYNNRFYVMEGNKRVSVFKYMDAASIEGYVTRMVPKRSDEHEVRIYYEFMEFYDITGINYLDMGREGNYKKLLKLVRGEDHWDEKWDKEAEQEFRMLFINFEKEYLPKANDKWDIKSGDALCLYLSIFGYKESVEKTQADIRRDIIRLWNEFVNYSKGTSMALVLNPTPESQKSALSLSKLLGGNTLKIAFIHDRKAEISGWTYSHELGRNYVENTFGDKIAVSVTEMVDDEKADEAFDRAIEAGNKVIFATSPKLTPAALRAAAAHPETIILNCSMSLSHKAIRSYYVRMYEAKFILGAIAGSIKDAGNIGYLADYPIHGTTADINAFALGVQMTNPEAKVYLEWSMLKDHNAFEEFRKKNVTLVSGRDLNATLIAGKELGLYKIGKTEEDRMNLAMPVRHWGKLYEEIIRSVMRGGYKNDDNVFGDQALNYFWGMSSGAVDVIYSRNLEAGQIRLLRSLRSGIQSMAVSPFTGPIYSQDGSLRCADGDIITPEAAVNIDWLADNIDGYIPSLEEMREDAVELVRIQGIKED